MTRIARCILGLVASTWLLVSGCSFSKSLDDRAPDIVREVMTLHGDGKIDEALALIAKELDCRTEEAGPGVSALLFTRGWLFEDGKAEGAAIPEYEAAVRAYPKNWAARENLVNLLATRNKSKAKSYLREGVMIASTPEERHALWRALPSLTKRAKLNSREVEYLYEHFSKYLVAGSPAAATRTLEEILPKLECGSELGDRVLADWASRAFNARVMTAAADRLAKARWSPCSEHLATLLEVADVAGEPDSWWLSSQDGNGNDRRNVWRRHVLATVLLARATEISDLDDASESESKGSTEPVSGEPPESEPSDNGKPTEATEKKKRADLAVALYRQVSVHSPEYAEYARFPENLQLREQRPNTRLLAAIEAARLTVAEGRRAELEELFACSSEEDATRGHFAPDLCEDRFLNGRPTPDERLIFYAYVSDILASLDLTENDQLTGLYEEIVERFESRPDNADLRRSLIRERLLRRAIGAANDGDSKPSADLYAKLSDVLADAGRPRDALDELKNAVDVDLWIDARPGALKTLEMARTIADEAREEVDERFWTIEDELYPLNGFYLGFSVGAALSADNDDDVREQLEARDHMDITVDLDQPSLGLKAYGGYRFDRVPVAVEIGFTHLGGQGSSITVLNENTGRDLDADMREIHPPTALGPTLAIQTYPWESGRFSTTLKLGAWYWFSDVDVGINGVSSGNFNFDIGDKDGADFFLGAGVQVRLDDHHWHVRAEWERYFLGRYGLDDGVDLYSVGLMYRF